MKYIYNEYTDLINQITKPVNLYVHEQQVPVGENDKGEKTYIVSIVCQCVLNNEMYVSTTPILPTTEMNEEQYVEHIKSEFIKLCKTVKEMNPKITIIRGGIEE